VFGEDGFRRMKVTRRDLDREPYCWARRLSGSVPFIAPQQIRSACAWIDWSFPVTAADALSNTIDP
jgi:hypothetical protein